MDKAHPLRSLIVVQWLDEKKEPFRPLHYQEELLSLKVPYLRARGKHMYLANITRPDVVYSVSLSTRYSSPPTRKHWNGVKHLLRYL